MNIRIIDGLPYVTVSILHRSHQLNLEKVLLDTGSAGTIFSADAVTAIGLVYEPTDMIHRIRGVGGSEFVFTKSLERLDIGDIHVNHFEVEIGSMDYGFAIDGIVGMDFLLQVGAIIDLAQIELCIAP